MGLNASAVAVPQGDRVEQELLIGMHVGRISQLIDLGVQARKPYKGTPKKPCSQIWVTYELTAKPMLDEDGEEVDDKNRWVSEKLNLFSMGQENALSTKRMQSFDPANALGGNWSLAVDMPLFVQIVNQLGSREDPPWLGIEDL